jgi:hypothetical protein
MDVHKPKPWHGVRDFLKEYAIIVIGVLTALAGEQGVEWLHWRQEVAEARAAVSVEFAGDIALADERARIAPCLANRIQQIAAILAQAAQTGRLPPVGELGGTPDREWSIPSWKSALASQAASHLPRAELLSLGSLAAYGDLIDVHNAEEVRVWAQLTAIVGPGRPIDPSEIGRLQGALSRAHLSAKQMTANSEQLARWIKRSGIASKGIWPDDPDPPGHVPVLCRPLGPAPSTYGQAPLGYELPGWKP